MNRLILFLLFIVYVAYLTAQCPTTPVFLSTQAEVDAFVVDYPFCTELDQSLRIEGNDITDLNGLFKLTSVSQGVLFQNNTQLPNLFGLESLTRIEGNLTVIGNDMLTHLRGLNNLEFVGGELQIESNDGLVNVNGLEKLDTISGQLFVYNNISLQQISAFDNLNYIGTNLIIALCPNLASCDAIGICNYVANPSGTIIIENNAVGCNSITEVEIACLNCGQLNSWAGPAQSTWHNSSNWSLNKIPTLCHITEIDSGNMVIVQPGLNAKCQTLEVATGAGLEIRDNAFLEVVPN